MCFVVCDRVALIFMFMSVVFVCLLSLFVPCVRNEFTRPVENYWESCTKGTTHQNRRSAFSFGFYRVFKSSQK